MIRSYEVWFSVENFAIDVIWYYLRGTYEQSRGDMIADSCLIHFFIFVSHLFLGLWFRFPVAPCIGFDHGNWKLGIFVGFVMNINSQAHTSENGTYDENAGIEEKFGNMPQGK